MNKCPSFPTFSLTFLVILFLIFWEFHMSTVYHFYSLPTSNPSVSFLLPPKSMTSLSHTYYIHNRLSPFSVAHTHTYLGLTITFGSPIMGRSQQPLSVCSSGWHVALWYPPHVGMPTGIIAVQGGHITMLWFYGFSILVSSRHCPAAGIIVLALTSFWFVFHEVPQAMVGWLIVLNNDRAIYHGEIT